VVEPLVDAVGVLGALDELFPDTPPDDWEPYRERYPEQFHRDEWRLWVMCFLVRAGGSTVVADTGAGPPGFWEGWEPEREKGLLPVLAGHGVQPGDVDVVFLTHVHVDHVGWNAHPDGRPVFENARYLLHPDALAAARERTDRPHVGHSILGLGDRVETVADGDEIAPRLERLCRPPPGPDGRAGGGELRLSFSQLHQFEVCPVLYRYRQTWGVPAPPDELLPQGPGNGAGGADLGASVHRALAAWHTAGGDLLELYRGPEAGLAMLRAYLQHPLASAPTLGCELEFNLRLGKVRVKGVVDRVCEQDGAITLVDYKTNAHLDERLRRVYAAQLRLYGLAAEKGVLPGGSRPRLILFDLRRGEASEVEPNSAQAEAWVGEAGGRIAAGDFRLRPEHADRPCFLCAYRPLCPDRRL